MVKAAVSAKVRKFVFSSVIHPSISKLSNHAAKRPVEEALYESGMEFTVLQPTMFMSNLPQVQDTVFQARRQAQQTPEWKAIYSQRAGIELTHSQGIRRSALCQSRYIGLKKTHLMQVFIACALNLVRLEAWLNGISLAQNRSRTF